MNDAPVRVEMHCHTRYSRDAFITEGQLLRECRRKGISCVCLTDHDMIDGALAFQKIVPLRIIVGDEVPTQSGEVIGLFLKEKVPAGLPLGDAIGRIKGQGGLVYLPHPFDEFRDAAVPIEEVERVKGSVDIIEVFNSRTLSGKYNEAAEAYARRNDLVAAVGSDAHHRWEIGNSLVEMDDFVDKNGFLRSLRKARWFTRRCPWTTRLYIKGQRILRTR